jgi:uncharacterized protein
VDHVIVLAVRALVDRESEAAALRSAVETAPSLVVLIGRRRVGKSFLLARTLDGDRVVSFQGDEQAEPQHLALLAEEAGRRLIGSTALAFASWEAALTFFGEQAAREPLTLVLDEFQWLKSAQPALDSIIQRHWDAWERDGVPITLILSGSALTMMERLLERGAPLYGRATARPRLAPLDFREAAAFADSEDPAALLRRWAARRSTTSGPAPAAWSGSSRSASWSRTRRCTTILATCCAKARASATRAPISRSCARSPKARRRTTRSHCRPASRPAT